MCVCVKRPQGALGKRDDVRPEKDTGMVDVIMPRNECVVHRLNEGVGVKACLFFSHLGS